jgi:YD repeat-containing protein
MVRISRLLSARILCLAQILAFVLIFPLIAGGQSGNDIVYVYDELGRLIAVIDPAGETATYSYDAVGNVLSISRFSSSIVSVIEFTPNGGPIGTNVTIYGTGFSTTPSQNTVSFNGVAATVTSSSATHIVTSVPSGATTGAIAVTTLAGSASSNTSFTVSASNAPTISSFTPTIGTSSTAVTISGTNFESSPANNSTRFNGSYAFVNSSTPTTISTTVPLAGASGRITVATQNGSAVSSDDFFIPPSPYTAPEVAFTGRMISGESKTVTLSAPNKIGMVLFDGIAGQRAYIKITSSSITTSSVSIYNQKGILTSTTAVGTSGGFLDASAFSMTGTYAIVVDPSSTYTGALTLTLYLSNDVISTISPGGAAVSVTTTTPGQNAQLSFSGNANQRVSLRLSGVSLTGGNGSASVYIKKPDGTTLASLLVVSSSGFMDTQTLPSAGAYTILLDPTGANIGSATLTLYDVPNDITGSITPGGSAITVTTTTPGQNAQLSFSGTANQRVSLRLSGVSLTGGNNSAYVYIKKPDGNTLASLLVVSSTGYMDMQTLPSAGAYTVLLDPIDVNLGSATLTLYDVQNDITGSITPGGSAITITTTTPGQNAQLSFSGTANQRISLKVSDVSLTGGNGAAYVYIKKPDGTTLASLLVVSSSGFMDTQTLPSAGAYTVLLDPLDGNIGSATLTLYDVPNDITGSIAPGGSAVTVTTTTPGQNAQLSFSGTANQRISLNVSGVSLTGGTGTAYVYIKKPDGTSLTWLFIASGGGFIDVQTLPTGGNYTVLVDPNDLNIGSATLTLYDVPADVTETTTIGGSAVSVITTVPGQNGQVTFSGTSTQQVTVRLTNNTMSVVTVKLLKPDGTQLTSSIFSTSSFNLATQTLPTTGTYKITIDPSGANTGGISITVTNP